MAREPENYRLYIEQLNRAVPADREVLKSAEVAAFIGKSDKTAKRLVPLVNGCITKVRLAKWLCSYYG